MTYLRLAYDDQDTTDQMREDCTACGTHIDLVAPPIAPELLGDVPALATTALPQGIRKPEITVSEATAHLAARLFRDLD
jgi:hypothetical protein